MIQTPSLHDAETRGIVVRFAGFYDLMVGVLTLGRQGTFRSQTLDCAALVPGERVLDVGTGTGTLAIAATTRVPNLAISGVDPSANMVQKAREKAAKANANVSFDVGVIEAIDLPNDSVDVVLSSLMLHHLPPDVKTKGLSEVRRVLRTGGRFVVADFVGRAPLFHRLLSKLHPGRSNDHHHPHGHDHHHDHGHPDAAGAELVSVLAKSGFSDVRFVRLTPSYLGCAVGWKS